MLIFVSVFLPIVLLSVFNVLDLILLLINPIFIWIFSVNASLGPLIDDSTSLFETALEISALVSIA